MTAVWRSRSEYEDRTTAPDAGAGIETARAVGFVEAAAFGPFGWARLMNRYTGKLTTASATVMPWRRPKGGGASPRPIKRDSGRRH